MRKSSSDLYLEVLQNTLHIVPEHILVVITELHLNGQDKNRDTVGEEKIGEGLQTGSVLLRCNNDLVSALDTLKSLQDIIHIVFPEKMVIGVLGSMY